MRPQQWVKNGFVLGPLIFSASFQNASRIKEAMVAVAAFCLVSSVGYVVNDIHDRDADKLHPVKRKKRPLAAGDVSVNEAFLLLGCILPVLGALAFKLPAIIPGLLLYVALTFLYSIALKKLPVVDLFAIAFGFVLRVYTGSIAVGVPLTFWMSITTLCLAIYLAAGKRKQELVQNGPSARGVLCVYTPELLSSYAQTAAITTVVFYSLYVATVSSKLVYTMPLVLMGLFRYQLLLEVKERGEAPGETLLTDPFLLGIVISWGGLCTVLLN